MARHITAPSFVSLVTAIAIAFTAGCSGTSAPAPSESTSAPSAPATSPAAGTEVAALSLQPESIGQISPVHSCGTTLLSGQPSQADLELLKERGIKTVLSVRTEGEVSWDEATAVQDLGMQFVNVPFRGGDQLTDEVFEQVLAVLRDEAQQPVMIHCGSANRVGAVWYAYRRLDGNLSAEEAEAEAVTVGLRPRSLTLLARAEEYISKVQGEPTAAQSGPAAQELERLDVGDTASDFELERAQPGPDGAIQKVKLSELTREGPVVLVVLRGWPGYQCPACQGQFRDLVGNASRIQELGAKVLFVYPGPPDELRAKAQEFIAQSGGSMPEPFSMVIDPDYSFTSLYNLRWDAPRETAYPSTFVLDSDRQVKFSQISETHSGRADTQEVLRVLTELKAAPDQG